MKAKKQAHIMSQPNLFGQNLNISHKRRTSANNTPVLEFKPQSPRIKLQNFKMKKKKFDFVKKDSKI
jgi:hypothetical protein